MAFIIYSMVYDMQCYYAVDLVVLGIVLGSPLSLPYMPNTASTPYPVHSK